MTLLVLCDHDRGVVSDSAYEALTFAKPISDSENISLQAVLIGEGAEEAAKSIISFGVEIVNIATHECLTDYGPEIWSETLTQIANETEAKIIVSSGTDRGNEVLAHVAARLEMPFLANCRKIERFAARCNSWDELRALVSSVVLQTGSPRSLCNCR